MKKIKRQFNRGDTTGMLLAVVVVLGIALAGATLTARQYPILNQYTLLQETPSQNHTTLQLKTLRFAVVTPPPERLPTGSLASCGYNLSGSTEPDILYAYNVTASRASGNQLALEVFYDDEHMITLGEGGVSPMLQHPADQVVNPNFGNTASTDKNHYTYAPSVYLTDVTNNPNDTSGDAQNGGQPHFPNQIYGAWKGLGVNDGNQPNGKNLAGGDIFPTTSNGPTGFKGHDTTWTAELVWLVSGLTINGQPLQSGHKYRAQFQMRDGDSIGDIGDGCTIITIP